jgi:hypothetical protein
MAARSRGVVRMMTRTLTTHPRGVKLEGPGVWQTLGKKKVYTYILIYTYGGTYMFVRWGGGLESGKL